LRAAGAAAIGSWTPVVSSTALTARSSSTAVAVNSTTVYITGGSTAASKAAPTLI
jgi:hypothetical protein